MKGPIKRMIREEFAPERKTFFARIGETGRKKAVSVIERIKRMGRRKTGKEIMERRRRYA